MENEAKKPRVEVMDFYADWCGPCRVMKPIIEELEPVYADKVKFTVIDVDQNQELANQYQVLSIPTYIFKKDGKIVDQMVGAIPKDQMVKKLDGLLGQKE